MVQLNYTNHKPISAIYYALLQCGYEFYPIERDLALSECLRQFANSDVPGFFGEVKQTTCEVYPYWPRAAILESATFFLTPDLHSFADFDALQRKVMTAGNIADAERTQSLWDWIETFPHALTQVLHTASFARYFDWENMWLSKQQMQHRTDLQEIQALLSRCVERYGSTIKRVQIVQNPIKCVYSADYHVYGDCLVYCSGTLDISAVVHEFMHTVLHPLVLSRADEIQNSNRSYAELDPTYCAVGKLNAFEEYAVRKLTACMLAGNIPDDLHSFLTALE